MAVRRHIVTLVPPLAVGVMGMAVADIAGVIGDIAWIRIGLWLLAAFLLFRLLVNFVDWYMGFLIITSRRLILPSGPLARETSSVELKAILRVSIHRPVRGRLVGFADLVLISGQGEVVVDYITYPDSVYNELSERENRDRRLHSGEVDLTS
jgi:hypothetical protein